MLQKVFTSVGKVSNRSFREKKYIAFPYQMFYQFNKSLHLFLLPIAKMHIKCDAVSFHSLLFSVVGDKIHMMCDHDGIPRPVVSWTKNDLDLSAGALVQSEGRILTIQSAQVSTNRQTA